MLKKWYISLHIAIDEQNIVNEIFVAAKQLELEEF